MELLPESTGGLALALAASACAGAVWYSLFLPLAQFSTGEQRRKAYPLGQKPIVPAGPIPVRDDQVKVTQGFYRLKKATIVGEAGQQIFYSSYTPAHGKISFVIAFVHGFSEHHDGMLTNVLRAYACKFNAHVIAFDHPGHGRSDGLFVYMPEWFEFVRCDFPVDSRLLFG